MRKLSKALTIAASTALAGAVAIAVAQTAPGGGSTTPGSTSGSTPAPDRA